MTKKTTCPGCGRVLDGPDETGEWMAKMGKHMTIPSIWHGVNDKNAPNYDVDFLKYMRECPGLATKEIEKDKHMTCPGCNRILDLPYESGRHRRVQRGYYAIFQHEMQDQWVDCPGTMSKEMEMSEQPRCGGCNTVQAAGFLWENNFGWKHLLEGHWQPCPGPAKEEEQEERMSRERENNAADTDKARALIGAALVILSQVRMPDRTEVQEDF